MVRYCARTGFGAAMIAAFLTTSSHADSPTIEPEAQAPVAETTVATAPASEAVPAQTVSTLTPAPRTLFGHTSYPEAWTAAQKSNRPILLYVTMSGCPHCEKMIDETYHLPEVERMVIDSFESIQVNGSQQPALAKSLKVKWYPTTILVGPNNKVVDVIEGYVDAKTFERRLQTGLASTDSSTQTR